MGIFDSIEKLIEIIGRELYEILSKRKDHVLGENGKDKDCYLLHSFSEKENRTVYNDGEAEHVEVTYVIDYLVNEDGLIRRSTTSDYSCGNLAVTFNQIDYVYYITKLYKLNSKASQLLEEYVLVKDKLSVFAEEET